MANTFAATEIDTGAGHPVGIFAAGPPELIPLLQPVANLLQPFGAGVLRSTEEGGADIAALAGVPGFAPIQESSTYFHYHHTAADTLDKVNPVNLQENAAVVAALTLALANSQRALPRPSAAPAQ